MVVGVAEQVSVTPVRPWTTPWQALQGHVLVEPRLNPNQTEGLPPPPPASAPSYAAVYQLHTNYAAIYEAAVAMVTYQGEMMLPLTLHMAASNSQLSNGGPPAYAYTFEVVNGKWGWGGGGCCSCHQDLVASSP
jgi:hypothetical protein